MGLALITACWSCCGNKANDEPACRSGMCSAVDMCCMCMPQVNTQSCVCAARLCAPQPGNGPHSCEAGTLSAAHTDLNDLMLIGDAVLRIGASPRVDRCGLTTGDVPARTATAGPSPANSPQLGLRDVGEAATKSSVARSLHVTLPLFGEVAKHCTIGAQLPLRLNLLEANASSSSEFERTVVSIDETLDTVLAVEAFDARALFVWHRRLRLLEGDFFGEAWVSRQTASPPGALNASATSGGLSVSSEPMPRSSSDTTWRKGVGCGNSSALGAVNDPHAEGLGELRCEPSSMRPRLSTALTDWSADTLTSVVGIVK